MKRFFLYLVLFLFVAGFATLAWGFWNAQKTRSWSRQAGEIKAHHDISSKVKDVQEKMNASGGKTAEEFGGELAVFTENLNAISRDLDSALAETAKIGVSPAARTTAAELADFYKKSGAQVRDMAGVAGFLGQVFDIAVIFDRIKPDATAQDVRNMVSEAKAKSADVKVEILPEEMRNSGNELKVATENYLDQFDQFATGKVEAHDQLNASYDEFSLKTNDFLVAKKKYFDSFENMDAVAEKIDGELLALKKVKFSVK